MQLTTLARQLALGAFALWLALWPAGDAITGTSRILIVLSPAAAAPSPCCGGAASEPAPCAAKASACAAARTGEAPLPRCGEARTPVAGSERACAGSRAARCGQCFCISGLVLFATVTLGYDPDFDLVGRLSPGDRVGLTRHLRPPIRPPAAALSIAA